MTKGFTVDELLRWMREPVKYIVKHPDAPDPSLEDLREALRLIKESEKDEH